MLRRPGRAAGDAVARAAVPAGARAAAGAGHRGDPAGAAGAVPGRELSGRGRRGGGHWRSTRIPRYRGLRQVDPFVGAATLIFTPAAASGRPGLAARGRPRAPAWSRQAGGRPAGAHELFVSRADDVVVVRCVRRPGPRPAGWSPIDDAPPPVPGPAGRPWQGRPTARCVAAPVPDRPWPSAARVTGGLRRWSARRAVGAATASLDRVGRDAGPADQVDPVGPDRLPEPRLRGAAARGTARCTPRCSTACRLSLTPNRRRSRRPRTCWPTGRPGAGRAAVRRRPVRHHLRAPASCRRTCRACGAARTTGLARRVHNGRQPAPPRWPAVCATGTPELLLPLFDLLETYLDDFRDNARRLYGAPASCCPAAPDHPRPAQPLHARGGA